MQQEDQWRALSADQLLTLAGQDLVANREGINWDASTVLGEKVLADVLSEVTDLSKYVGKRKTWPKSAPGKEETR